MLKLASIFGQLIPRKPVVEDDSRQWTLDCYAWAMAEFGEQFFKNSSQLILPTNEYYQGSVNSVHGMAQSVFQQTLSYAGMSKWPIRLLAPQQLSGQPLPRFNILGDLRGEHVAISSAEDIRNTIEISYNPTQVNQPQDLVSSFVQILSAILVNHAKTLPPGGKNTIPQAVDLVACFMGFGIIFSNTAYQFRGGCGSCNIRSANRQANLPELETVYATALFCVLKNIPAKDGIKHLKSHLRQPFKRAYKSLNATATS